MALLHEPAPTAFAEGSQASQLQPFVETVFDSLARADQRTWAELYIKALLQTPGDRPCSAPGLHARPRR